jgi:hypothetical protein
MARSRDAGGVQQKGGKTLGSGGRTGGRKQLEDRACAEDVEAGCIEMFGARELLSSASPPLPFPIHAGDAALVPLGEPGVHGQSFAEREEAAQQ